MEREIFLSGFYRVNRTNRRCLENLIAEVGNRRLAFALSLPGTHNEVRTKRAKIVLWSMVTPGPIEKLKTRHTTVQVYL